MELKDAQEKLKTVLTELNLEGWTWQVIPRYEIHLMPTQNDTVKESEGKKHKAEGKK